MGGREGGREGGGERERGEGGREGERERDRGKEGGREEGEKTDPPVRYPAIGVLDIKRSCFWSLYADQMGEAFSISNI